MIDYFLYAQTLNRVRTYDIVDKIFEQRWWLDSEEIPKFVLAFCESLEEEIGIISFWKRLLAEHHCEKKHT